MLVVALLGLFLMVVGNGDNADDVANDDDDGDDGDDNQ